MRSLFALALTAAAAVVAGGLAFVVALVATGAALLSMGGAAFGGSIDPSPRPSP